MQMQNLQHQHNVDLWNMQNAYNTPLAQMQRFQEAGLNPHLIYSKGSPGNAGAIQPAQYGTVDQRRSSLGVGNALSRWYQTQMMESQVRSARASAQYMEHNARYKGSKADEQELRTAPQGGLMWDGVKGEYVVSSYAKELLHTALQNAVATHAQKNKYGRWLQSRIGLNELMIINQRDRNNYEHFIRSRDMAGFGHWDDKMLPIVYNIMTGGGAIPWRPGWDTYTMAQVGDFAKLILRGYATGFGFSGIGKSFRTGKHSVSGYGPYGRIKTISDRKTMRGNRSILEQYNPTRSTGGGQFGGFNQGSRGSYYYNMNRR